MSAIRIKVSILVSSLFAFTLAGCGTTRWSDTSRTATEQFLISHAIDEVVGRMDFRVLAGKTVFFEEKYLEDTVHRKYLASSLRQQLLACGVLLQEKRDASQYVVEARTGVIGTNRNDSMFGIPQLSLPPLMPGIPTTTPEIALAKKTNQRAAAKIAVYAFHRETGHRVWQSGLVVEEAYETNNWFLGIGPAQKSSYRDGIQFIGERVEMPFTKREEDEAGPILLHQEAFWEDPVRGPQLEQTIQRVEHTASSDPSSFDDLSQINQPQGPPKPAAFSNQPARVLPTIKP